MDAVDETTRAVFNTVSAGMKAVVEALAEAGVDIDLVAIVHPRRMPDHFAGVVAFTDLEGPSVRVMLESAYQYVLGNNPDLEGDITLPTRG